MRFVDPVTSIVLSYLISTHLEANSCQKYMKVWYISVLAKTVAYLDCRLKGCSLSWYSAADIPFMQNLHIFTTGNDA